jgi:hypothetical protein
MWVVVGNRGAVRTVEATGARVGNTRVPRRRLRGELELIQSIEHNNNCFYTN